MNVRDYIFLARPDHWFKNVFMLPGVAAALYLTGNSTLHLLPDIVLALVAVCLTASANYVINEWLDAEFDRFHPVKSQRPSAAGRVQARFVYLEYFVLASVSLVLAWTISREFFAAAMALLVMGVIYNVKPLRSKDLPYLDVLSESVNNPLRLYLGWFAVTSDVLPPSSLVAAYWMAGAFLMAVKRYTELSFLGQEVAATYRRSFRYYTPSSLLASILFYAMAFSFFFGVFLVKHKIELIVALPLFFILFCWYLSMGMDPASHTKSPEKLYREKKFLAFLVLLVLVCTALLYLDVPQFHYFLNNNFAR